MSRVIRVLLAGGGEVVREGLRQMLGGRGVVLVGEAPSGQEALAKVETLFPDVVILVADDSLPVDGLVRRARVIGGAILPARVVILAEDPIRYLAPAVKAGAAAVLPTDITPDDLLAAIRCTCLH